MSKNKFKVGDKIRCIDNSRFHAHLTVGKVYTVLREDADTRYVHIEPDHGVTTGGYKVERFELVQEDAVLTPEEVFEHLQKGTKLQHLVGTYGWKDVTTPEELYYTDICSEQFRIKPEPEIITLNGKRYQALED